MPKTPNNQYGNLPFAAEKQIYLNIKNLEAGDYILKLTNNNRIVKEIKFTKKYILKLLLKPKIMKTTQTFLLIFFLGLSSFCQAQFLDKLGKRAANAVERTVERRVERETEKSTDRVLDTIVDAPKKTKKQQRKEEKERIRSGGNIIGGNNNTGNLEKQSNTSLEEVGSNTVNFTRGSQIIFNDNFQKDAVGDFPARWNTTRGGEVKNLSGFPAKYLKISGGSVTSIELTKPLPENFTVEFDLILSSDSPLRWPGIGFGKEPVAINYIIPNHNTITFDIISAEKSNGMYKLNYASKDLGVEKQNVAYKAPLNQIIKMAFEVNGARIRLFIDGKKMVDLPTMFKPEYRKSLFFTSITNGWQETKEAYFYISNVVVAGTGGDERSQVLKDLMEKGSFSTNAILFNSGSATIKPGSESILSDLAEALKTNSDLKLKVVGHTDSDGGDDSNLKLSKDRADSVRQMLISKFGIAANRLTADGKGESQPISDNSTSSGKEQNRRVEFIKL